MKTMRHTKKNGNVTYNQKSKQSIETDPSMTRTVSKLTTLSMFKGLEITMKRGTERNFIRKKIKL